MTELYKLLFDISLYYTLTSYFGMMIFLAGPSPIGFLCLIAVIIADCILHRWESKWALRCRIAVLLLPVAILFTDAAWFQILQMIPPWAYIVWSILSNRITVDYSGFKDHFNFGMKLLLLLLFGIPFWGRIVDAFVGTVPYLVVLFADGICLLRMLREKQRCASGAVFGRCASRLYCCDGLATATVACKRLWSVLSDRFNKGVVCRCGCDRCDILFPLCFFEMVIFACKR